MHYFTITDIGSCGFSIHAGDDAGDLIDFAINPNNVITGYVITYRLMMLL